MYFALFERLRQFRECGLPMWIQLTHHVDPTFSQDNFDNSTILRAIHTLLCRSLNHALVVETVQQPGHRSRIDCQIASQIAGRRCWSRSEEHKSELQSLIRSSYAVFCL